MKEKEFNNIVVLIDAENISPQYAKSIFENIAIFGNVSVRRIYGDWSNNKSVGRWIGLLQEYSLVPVQQFNNIGTKNVSDFTIVIDAMDLVHDDIFDCFCFVSSDSDFTRLAQRIKEKGKCVIGIGEAKTPKAFVNACSYFTYLNEAQTKKRIERKKPRPAPAAADTKVHAPAVAPGFDNFEVNETDFAEYDASEENKDLIELALENLQEDDGWVMISKIIPYIQRIKSDFKIEDIKIKGKRLRKFSDYFSSKEFEVNKPNGENIPGPIYVRKR